MTSTTLHNQNHPYARTTDDVKSDYTLTLSLAYQGAGMKITEETLDNSNANVMEGI